MMFRVDLVLFKMTHKKRKINEYLNAQIQSPNITNPNERRWFIPDSVNSKKLN